jgi:putative two-component system response regulator
MKVLVVDDENVSLMTLKVFATKLGYDVLAASNGKDAYRIWKEESPEIVITDWEMPEMNGLELCTSIRSEIVDAYTYIIVVTGRDNIKDVVQGMEAGADDYITKPFNKDELSVRIKAGERIIHLQTKDVVICSLAKLAESRDEDTGQHLDRVRHYSRVLSESLYRDPNRPSELNIQLIESIFMTAPLHDIGKVGIPDYILLKPGLLDDQEFGIMKTHTLIGYNTLMDTYQRTPQAKYLKVAAEIARNHHEKFDGGGYPDGLKGNEIPLSCRIFALADVYDALVSKRPYKEAFAHERAKSIISNGKGDHFDPKVVEAFLLNEHHFCEIHEKYEDRVP